MTPARTLFLLIPLSLLPMWLRAGNGYDSLATLFLVAGGALVWAHRHVRFRRIDLLLSGLLVFWCLVSVCWPQAWTVGPSWRESLPLSRQAYLPWTHSPQPWISMESILLLAYACVWWGMARGLPDVRRVRYPLMAWMLLGIAATTVVALLDYAGVWDLAYWQPNLGIGPFENRNQFACILAIGVTLAGGLFLYDQRRRTKRSVAWAVLGITLLAAVAVNGSRAGIVLSFAGLLSLAVGEFVIYRRLDRTGKAMAIGLTLLAAAIFWGGTAWERLFPTAVEASSGLDRGAIQSDALTMMTHAPALGAGLGQFSYVFPLHHDQFAPDKRVIHPESDWLWLGTEAGVPGWIIVLIWIGICIRDFLPLSKTRDRRLRWVAAVGGLILFLHSWVDVSAHRPGTLFPVLLLVAMSCRNRMSQKSRPRPGLALMAGILFITVGTLMWLNLTGVVRLPGSLDQPRAVAAAREALEHREITTRDMDDMLRRAPLSPTLHYLDGVAHLTVLDGPARSADAFQASAALAPYFMDLQRAMAQAWLSRDLNRTVAAWRDALTRARDMRSLQASKLVQENPDPLSRELLWSLVPEFPDLILPLASYTRPEELNRYTALVANTTPPRDPATVETIVQIWSGGPDPAAMLESIENAEGWKDHAWLLRVRVLATQGDYESATQLLKANLRFNDRQLPRISPEQAQQAQKRLMRTPGDTLLRLQLASYYYQQGQAQGAEEKLRPLFAAAATHPAYVYWIMAEAAIEKRAWPQAYEYLIKFKAVSGQEAGRQ